MRPLDSRSKIVIKALSRPNRFAVATLATERSWRRRLSASYCVGEFTRVSEVEVSRH